MCKCHHGSTGIGHSKGWASHATADRATPCTDRPRGQARHRGRWNRSTSELTNFNWGRNYCSKADKTIVCASAPPLGGRPQCKQWYTEPKSMWSIYHFRLLLWLLTWLHLRNRAPPLPWISPLAFSTDPSASSSSPVDTIPATQMQEKHMHSQTVTASIGQYCTWYLLMQSHLVDGRQQRKRYPELFTSLSHQKGPKITHDQFQGFSKLTTARHND